MPPEHTIAVPPGRTAPDDPPPPPFMVRPSWHSQGGLCAAHPVRAWNTCAPMLRLTVLHARRLMRHPRALLHSRPLPWLVAPLAASRGWT
jgi:hypothetical protein